MRFEGRIADGDAIDSSEKRGRPLEFTVGDGRVIKGLDEAVRGMAVGETKTLRVPPEKAYGVRREDLVIKVPRSRFPAGLTPEKGLPMNIRHKDGSMLDVVVTEVSEDTVTLDGNHPLAGREFDLEIELLEIIPEPGGGR
ncbi:MAG: peptidylprolyl isomerase [Thermodesulfovibrionales bacterium]